MKSANKRIVTHITVLFIIFVLFARIFFIPWIIGDGLHYYATLRSFVIDGDINFKNEYSYFRTLNRGAVVDPNYKTVTGLAHNQWAVGNAIFWSPFFLMAHISEILHGGKADGYSQTYYNFVTFGTLIFSFLSLILVYLFLKKFVRDSIALLATTAIFICSTLFYYTFYDPSMSHVFSMFTVSSFLYYWYITHRKGKLHQYIFLGFLAGLMMLSRWQNGLFMTVVLYEFFDIVAEKDFFRFLLHIGRVTCFLIIAGITFLPQMIFWKVLYGSYLTVPIPEFEFYWYPRYFLNMLFSLRHSLLAWTPLVIFSLGGFYFMFKENRKLALYFGIPLILQMLFISGTSVWDGSWSYGIRMLTSCTLIFAIGLAFLVKELNKKFSLGIICLCLSPFILWNILLMAQIHYYHFLIDPEYPFYEIAVNQIKIAPKLLVRLLCSKFGTL